MGSQTLFNPVPIEYEAGSAPESVWTFWKREKPPDPTGTRTPDHPGCSLDSILSTLPQLHIPAASIKKTMQVYYFFCFTYSDLWEQIRCVRLSVEWSWHQYSWHAYSTGGTRWSGRSVSLVHSMTARWMNEWHEELLHSVACLALEA
jgi:hypothetical protein